MSGGFSSIIGFLFVFFFIIFSYFIIFTNYEDSLIFQNDVLEEISENENLNLKTYEVEKSYLSSGRIKTQIKSLQNKLKIKNNFQNCFEITNNNTYLFNEYLSVNPISNNFFSFNILNKNQIGFIEFYFGENEIKNQSINFFDCIGNKKNLFLNSSLINNFINYKYKETLILNSEINNRENHVIDIDLNQHINLSKYNGNLKIISPIKENLILDLTFDNYKQNLEDYSIKNYNVYLGNTSLIESEFDPKKSKGVILNGLDFFENSTIKISNFDFTDLPLTISFWFKPNENINKNNESFSFIDFDEKYYISFNSNNDGKISFSKKNTNYIFSTNTNNWENDKWHNVVIKLNDDNGKIYVNGKLENTSFSILQLENIENVFIGNLENNDKNNTIKIDEVKIFNLDLNDNQIKNLYQNNLNYVELEYNIKKYIPNLQFFINITFPFVEKNHDFSYMIFYE